MVLRNGKICAPPRFRKSDVLAFWQQRFFRIYPTSLAPLPLPIAAEALLDKRNFEAYLHVRDPFGYPRECWFRRLLDRSCNHGRHRSNEPYYHWPRPDAYDVFGCEWAPRRPLLHPYDRLEPRPVGMPRRLGSLSISNGSSSVAAWELRSRFISSMAPFILKRASSFSGGAHVNGGFYKISGPRF